MTHRTPVPHDLADTDGHMAVDGEAPGTAVQPSDEQHAVRVRLAIASAIGAERALRIGPGPGPATSGVSTQRHADVDGVPRDVELVPGTDGRATLRVGAERSPVILGPQGPGLDRTMSREILVDGFRFDVEVQSERLAALRERATRAGASAARSGSFEVRAIIPGNVVSVAVAPGDVVVAGQQLLVVEAMKMQNELRATRAGTAATVAVEVGQTVEAGDLLVVIE